MQGESDGCILAILQMQTAAADFPPLEQRVTRRLLYNFPAWINCSFKFQCKLLSVVNAQIKSQPEYFQANSGVQSLLDAIRLCYMDNVGGKDQNYQVISNKQEKSEAAIMHYENYKDKDSNFEGGYYEAVGDKGNSPKVSPKGSPGGSGRNSPRKEGSPMKSHELAVNALNRCESSFEMSNFVSEESSRSHLNSSNSNPSLQHSGRSSRAVSATPTYHSINQSTSNQDLSTLNNVLESEIIPDELLTPRSGIHFSESVKIEDGNSPPHVLGKKNNFIDSIVYRMIAFCTDFINRLS